MSECRYWVWLLQLLHRQMKAHRKWKNMVLSHLILKNNQKRFVYIPGTDSASSTWSCAVWCLCKKIKIMEKLFLSRLGNCTLIPNTPCLFRWCFFFFILTYSVLFLSVLTSANHEEMLCIQYIFTVPAEHLAISRHFLHTCFDEGPLITFTHHHLRHSALTSLINQHYQKRKSL